uniref:Sugar transporter SWEET n=1 Tax=Ditylenchus dipsaci TaxID=166011 RepID=A0A915CTL2_9BILA
MDLFGRLTFQSALSITAVITTVALLFCGFPICFNIYRRKSTEDISSFPFILGFLSGTLWLRYGLLIGDFAMITCNSVAISLMIFYLVFYTYYTQPKLSILVKIAVDVVFIALILTVVQIFEDKAREPLGFVSMIFNAINFGAPLGGLAVVLRTRSFSSEWLLYGFVIKDKYLIIPNSAGVALALIQISFFLVLPRAPGKIAPLGYCCSCVRNLQTKQVEKPSKQDLAKNGQRSTWKRPKVGDVNANEVTISNVTEPAEHKGDVKIDVVDE